MSLSSWGAKIPALVFLAVAMNACNPLPKTPDEEDAEREKNRPKATATPKPPPGAWMYDKRKDPLAPKDTSTSKDKHDNPLDKKAFK